MRRAAGHGRQPLVRVRAGGHRHRCAQCQLPPGHDRAAGQPLALRRRRGGSPARAARLPAGGRHRCALPRGAGAGDQRRQRRHGGRNGLRQCAGYEGFHHDYARHGTRIGFRRQRRHDLRPRRLRGRTGPRGRRARRAALRLRTLRLPGDLRVGHGRQAHGVRDDGPDDRAEPPACRGV